MNLSNQSREMISQIGSTIGALYSMRLSPLQILILVESRFSEARLGKGKHLFADKVRKEVSKIYEEHGSKPPSRQSFWDAFNALRDDGLLYIAPHKKGTSKRAIVLTALGTQPFRYPKSIHPYRTP
jgi:hypothetical protein